MERKRVLITVTTYPLPSNKYQELVCTAGFTENGKWIRIYPIPLSYLVNNRYRKYDWIEIDLSRREISKDFRPESFNPVNNNLSDIVKVGSIDTKGHWAERKKVCLKKVYTNLEKLISEAKNPSYYTSLATFKPTRITDFKIIPDDRDWKPEWKASMEQYCLFTEDPDFERLGIKKVPYKFKYVFEDDSGKSSTMMIEDWEIGQLYWNCLKSYGTVEEAVKKVREKYFDTLAKKRDTYLFLGTSLTWHKRGRNPFMIIGVFYPTIDPNQNQMSLF